jgi:tight adherence protein C
MENIILPILVFVIIVSLGGMVIMWQNKKRAALASRLNASENAAADIDQGESALQGFLGLVGRILSPGDASQTLREQMAQAGFFTASAPNAYMGAKMLLLFIGLLVVPTIGVSADAKGVEIAMATAISAISLSFLPNIVVSSYCRRRKMEVQQSLPDAIDLLEICVNSGMGLDQAWNAVADEIRRVSQILGDEMALTNLEMHIGAQRADALRNMSRRTNVDEMASLASVLVQSERFGASISTALKEFANTMREDRSQRAEESAEKMAVKLLIPMIMFIFPAILIVTTGPAIINVLDVFNNLEIVNPSK